MSVKIVWSTPDIDRHIAFMARVSNPDGQDKEIGGLIKYMMTHGHVSPFEMCNVCIAIDTTRDIGRQILRHRSFSFQEFSQRYQDATKLGDMKKRECRTQDSKNRQNSLEVEDPAVAAEWNKLQDIVIDVTAEAYRMALSNGVAKEQARALLPEGLTRSRMYMNGSLRSWIFYLKQRLDPSTQKEHREIAEKILGLLRKAAPVTMSVFFPKEEI